MLLQFVYLLFELKITFRGSKKVFTPLHYMKKILTPPQLGEKNSLPRPPRQCAIGHTGLYCSLPKTLSEGGGGGQAFLIFDFLKCEKFSTSLSGEGGSSFLNFFV